MRIQTRWEIAGAIWGALLGGFFALWAVGAAAGVFWLWLYGDDPWPESASIWILGIGLVVWIVCIWIGWNLGRARGEIADEKAGYSLQVARRAATRALLLAILALAGAGYFFVDLRDAGQKERAVSEERERAYQHLLQTRHTFRAITASHDAATHALHLTIGTAGQRSGPHRLTVQVTSSRLGDNGWERTEVVSLGTGLQTLTRRVPLGDIKILVGRSLFGDAETRADADVLLTVGGRLVPIISDALADSLPSRVLRNIDLESSNLIDEVKTMVTVSFSFP